MTYKIYGHRGSRTRLPENTMPSFKLAVEEGADGLEIDIRTTKDGEVVICHDADLKRVGGVDFTVSEHTWEELSKFSVHCPEVFGEKYKDQIFVPRLEELLAYLTTNDALLNIEIKQQPDREYGDIEKKTLALVEQYGLKDRVFYSSFDHYILVKLKELDPTIKTAILYSSPIYRAAAYAKELGCFATHPSMTGALQYDDLQFTRELGMDCNVWTINNTDNAKKLVELGATGIITDLPLETVRALRG